MLDEPSMGLAPILVEQIFDIIQELNQHGHHYPPGGAECPDGPVCGRPGLCAGDRARSSPTGSGEELLEDEAVKKAYLGG